MKLAMLALACWGLASGVCLAGPNSPTPAAISMVQVGSDLAVRGPNDMPLYTFDKDTQGKSNCVDQCATAWPPLAADADAKAVGDWSVVTRPDGSRQWAHKGKPVYTFKPDTPGNATGDGRGGVWRLVKP